MLSAPDIDAEILGRGDVYFLLDQRERVGHRLEFIYVTFLKRRLRHNIRLGFSNVFFATSSFSLGIS